MSKENFVGNVVAIATTIELVKMTINKLGYEHIAALDKPIQNEKISQSINSAIKRIED